MTEVADTGQGPAGSALETAAEAPTASKSLYFVRRVTAMQDFEVFFVTSVATILLVRMILAATGWPQLGGGKIHFAHLLWGGIGMLLAFILFMAMQGRLWDFLATLSAGIGFGLFLDELGKFITSDNDYFFQPAVAIMYVLFVVLFFLFRALGRVDKMGPETALVNSFDFAKEAVMRAMSRGERDEALYVLGRADQSDPMVQASPRYSARCPCPPRAPTPPSGSGRGSAAGGRDSSGAAGSGASSSGGSSSRRSSGC